MSSFQSCDYSIFNNEQQRFDNLLNICKNNTGKTIIYSRYKYITLLFFPDCDTFQFSYVGCFD